MVKIDVSRLDNSQYSIQGYGEPMFVVKNATPMSFGICFYGIILRDVIIGGGIKLLLSDADGNRYDITCLNITLEREADCSTVYTEPQLCEAGELAHITIDNIPNLEFTKGPVCFYMDDGNCGRDLGDNITVFWGNGKAFTLLNMQTGKVRKFVDEDGWLLIEDKDIDYGSIQQHHEHYRRCVDCKYVEFGFNRYDDFKNGLCALVWTPYPDGRYFADEDGFGMEDNDEEKVYCVINTDLDIIVPFQPMDDVENVLRGMVANGL